MEPVTPKLPLIDTLKALLIFLVVFGHLLEPVISGSPLIRDLYKTIYVFHIPAFIFLAGITSRKVIQKSRLMHLCVLLVVFQVLYVMLASPASEAIVHYSVTPYWLVWFLLSLIFWRCLVPLFHRFDYPVLLSFVIAFTADQIPFLGYELSAARTLIFLPFFMVGHFYGKEIIAFLGQQKAALRAVACGGGLIIVLLFAAYIKSRFLLYGSVPATIMAGDLLNALFFRSLHYLSACAGIVAVIVLAQSGKIRMPVRFGQRSLSIFLTHGLLVMLLRDELRAVESSIGSIGFIPLTFILAIILCYLCSFFENVLRWQK